ncbi:MAG: hypothetical protein QF561_07115 [Phycisphaerales bacterium]|jgi:hypothetical protein|nr:hypothetical protein [Phycisphaerales bacterium]
MPDTHPTPLPLVVLIAADGPLWPEHPTELAGRHVQHVAIKSPLTPLAGLATTMATGVSPLTHDVVTNWVPDETGETLVSVSAAHRLFPAFWSDDTLGPATVTIDWPATQGDSDLPESHCRSSTGDTPKARSLAAINLLNEAASAPSTRAIALALGGLSHRKDREGTAIAITSELDRTLAALPSTTLVLIVHQTPEGTQHQLTIIGGDAPTDQHAPATTLSGVGGAIRRLTGAALSHGVVFGRTPGLTLPPIDPAQRTIPAIRLASPVDWEKSIQIAGEASDAEHMTMMTRRLACLCRYAFARRDWERMGKLAGDLASIRGEPFEHWMTLLAASRVNDQERLETAAATCVARFPESPLATLAQGMVQIATEPEAASSLLATLSASDLPMDTMLGVHGRLCIRAGLHELGRASLEQAMQRGVATVVDRIALAGHLLQFGQPDRARAALGSVGGPGGPKNWALLRLRVLKACGASSAAESLSQALIERHPGDADVRAAITG